MKYVQMKTENHGEFFSRCGTDIVAGRSAAPKAFGEDSALVLHFGWTATSAINSETGVIVHLKVPAYPPAIASAMTVLNARDNIKKMVIKCVDSIASSTGNNRGKISAIYTGEDGVLISASEANLTEKSNSELDLVIEFTKLTIENQTTNTTGMIKTTNAGG